MPTLETLVLWLHVAAGTVALAAGTAALATTKGGRRHRQAGRVFVHAMAVVVGTVLPLYAFAPTTFRAFLVLVAVFSGYLAFSGYRVLGRKRPGAAAAPVDWAAAGITVVACLLMGGWGVTRLAGDDAFGAVLVTFGAIGVGFAALDVRAFRAAGGAEGRSDGGNEWMVAHLQRMVGALVATVSAVSAVNLTPVLGGRRLAVAHGRLRAADHLLVLETRPGVSAGTAGRLSRPRWGLSPRRPPGARGRPRVMALTVNHRPDQDPPECALGNLRRSRYARRSTSGRGTWPWRATRWRESAPGSAPAPRSAA